MRIHAVLNAKAGTLLDGQAEVVRWAVKERLGANGNEVQVDLVEPSDIDAAMDDALAGDIDILAVGGGDGTILAAAKKLTGKPVTLGVIPLGTLNRFARDLDIPFDPVQAAAVIADGTQAAVDVADVNGHPFLCNSLLGLPIHVAEERQALRGSGLGERLRGYFTLFQNFRRNRRRFAIEVDDGHIAKPVRALSIAISNNPLSEDPGMTLKRARIDTGQLALYLSKHRSGGAMGWSIIRRMLGKGHRDPNVEEFFAKRITLRSDRSKVRVSNDGEIEEIDTPLRYSIAPRALRIMTPRSA